jgi:hypothetical protein
MLFIEDMLSLLIEAKCKIVPDPQIMRVSKSKTLQDLLATLKIAAEVVSLGKVQLSRQISLAWGILFQGFCIQVDGCLVIPLDDVKMRVIDKNAWLLYVAGASLFDCSQYFYGLKNLIVLCEDTCDSHGSIYVALISLQYSYILFHGSSQEISLLLIILSAPS